MKFQITATESGSDIVFEKLDYDPSVPSFSTDWTRTVPRERFTMTKVESDTVLFLTDYGNHFLQVCDSELVDNAGDPYPVSDLHDDIQAVIAGMSGGGSMTGAEIRTALGTELGSAAWEGGNDSSFQSITLAAAGVLISTAGIQPGGKYLINLPSGDLLYGEGFSNAEFGTEWNYTHFATGQRLRVRGTIDGAGQWALLQGDPEAVYQYTFNNDITTSLDFSALRMFGKFDLYNTGTPNNMALQALSNFLPGDKFTLFSSNASTLIDVNAAGLKFPESFLGNLTLTEYISIDVEVSQSSQMMVSKATCLNPKLDYIGGPRVYHASIYDFGSGIAVAQVIKNTTGVNPTITDAATGSYQFDFTGAPLGPSGVLSVTAEASLGNDDHTQERSFNINVGGAPSDIRLSVFQTDNETAAETFGTSGGDSWIKIEFHNI